MNYRIAIHPPAYAVGELECFYEQYAARGWLLCHRIGPFSVFHRDTPQRLRCRVEFGIPHKRGTWDESDFGRPELPAEQVALYEDCGWRAAAWSGPVTVFCAPAETASEELYDTPQQCAATLRALERCSIRQIVLSLVSVAIILAPFLAMQFAYSLLTEWLYLAPPLLPGYLLILLALLLRQVTDAVGLHALRKRLASGERQARTPARRAQRSRAALLLCALAGVVFLVLGAGLSSGTQRYIIPTTEPIPVLQLSDLPPSDAGWFYSDHPSATVTSGVLLTTWYSEQQLHFPMDQICFTYQYLYLFQSADAAQTLMEHHARNRAPHFAPEGWLELSAAGYDRVLTSPDGRCTMALRGQIVLVWELSSFEVALPTGEELLPYLSAAGEKIDRYLAQSKEVQP